MEGYEKLISGLVLFMVLHIISVMYILREKMLSAMGLFKYRLLHSIGSVLGLFLIVSGYSTNPREDLYILGEWSQKAPIYLMPIALIFLVGSRPISDIRRITRHPMLWAIVLWSCGHLLANGDKASVMLFGSFLIYGLLAMKLSDDKLAKSAPNDWEKIKSTTSVLPFVAIFQGRVDKPRGDLGLKAVIGGLFLYSMLLWFHGYFTGVSLIKLL
jgi:uncharacterized membrane protein